MSATQTRTLMRIGVFEDVSAAEHAVAELEAAGFRRDQISVLCSDDEKEKHFRPYESEEPGGSHVPGAAATGSVLGGVVGGLVSAGVSTIAGMPLIAVGPSFLVGGAVLGGLIGAMQTRGKEGALNDFYEQSLSAGKLLVAVHSEEPVDQQKLARAAYILHSSGAQPMPLEDPAGPIPHAQ
jgi:hypothetical protein